MKFWLWCLTLITVPCWTVPAAIQDDPWAALVGSWVAWGLVLAGLLISTFKVGRR